MNVTRAALSILALVIPSVVAAHHGWGGFDTSKALDHTGAVIQSVYANPHGELRLRHEGRDILVELAPVSRMNARGLSAEDIAPGKTVRIFAYQNRGDPNVYRAEWIEPAGKARVALR